MSDLLGFPGVPNYRSQRHLLGELLKKEPDPLEARAWAKKKVDELVRKAMEGV